MRADISPQMLDAFFAELKQRGAPLPFTEDAKAALEAAISQHIAELEARTEWRSMESAPKDGTEVIYWHPQAGAWIGNEPPGCARGIWRTDSSGDWLGQGQSLSGEVAWMSLPARPAEEPR